MNELKLDEARVDRLDEVLAFVDGILEGLDCPMKVQLQLDVAVEELYVNIGHYAYAPGVGPAVIRVARSPPACRPAQNWRAQVARATPTMPAMAPAPR